MGKSSGGVRGVTEADISAVTARDILISFSAIDAAASQRYKTSRHEQIAGEEMQRIMGYLDKDSLAYRILKSADPRRGLSDKQQWVVAYQLMKNSSYVKQVAAAKKRKAAERRAEAEFYHQNKERIQENRRKARQKKEAARKQRKAAQAEKIKQMQEQGYRLVQIGRQYKWVK